MTISKKPFYARVIPSVLTVAVALAAAYGLVRLFDTDLPGDLQVGTVVTVTEAAIWASGVRLTATLEDGQDWTLDPLELSEIPPMGAQICVQAYCSQYLQRKSARLVALHRCGLQGGDNSAFIAPK